MTSLVTCLAVKVKWSQLAVLCYCTITYFFVLLGNNKDWVNWKALKAYNLRDFTSIILTLKIVLGRVMN